MILYKSYILIADEAGFIYTFHALTLRLINRVQAHEKAITSMNAYSDGVLTSTCNQTKIWQLNL